MGVKNAIFVPSFGKSQGAPLRNYIFTRAIKYHYASNGNEGPVYCCGANDADLAGQITARNAQIEAIFDPIPVTFDYPNDAVTVYWLFDKENVMKLLRTADTGFETLIRDVFENQPPAYGELVNPAETPRKTGWTDEAGVKRQPPPSEKSVLSGPVTKPGLHSVQQVYEITINRLLQMDKDRFGHLRFGNAYFTAQLLYTELNKLVAGRVTETQALAYLDTIIKQNPDLFPQP